MFEDSFAEDVEVVQGEAVYGDVHAAARIASGAAEPVLSSLARQQIGWLCGDPMPDYAHVVYRSLR